MRDSLIIYKSTIDVVKELSRENRLKFYEAVFDYALNDIEPTNLTGVSKSFFALTKPLIDSNNKKYKNGCKGGRPKDTDSPRKEIDGIELTNLTEIQYQKLCERYGEILANKAIELFENWLARGNKTAREYIGKNHYAHFKSDNWTIKEAEKIVGQNKPNWSI